LSGCLRVALDAFGRRDGGRGAQAAALERSLCLDPSPLDRPLRLRLGRGHRPLARFQLELELACRCGGRRLSRAVQSKSAK
jgi:hypothetical protein